MLKHSKVHADLGFRSADSYNTGSFNTYIYDI